MVWKDLGASKWEAEVFYQELEISGEKKKKIREVEVLEAEVAFIHWVAIAFSH